MAVSTSDILLHSCPNTDQWELGIHLISTKIKTSYDTNKQPLQHSWSEIIKLFTCTRREKSWIWNNHCCPTKVIGFVIAYVNRNAQVHWLDTIASYYRTKNIYAMWRRTMLRLLNVDWLLRTNLEFQILAIATDFLQILHQLFAVYFTLGPPKLSDMASWNVSTYKPDGSVSSNVRIHCDVVKPWIVTLVHKVLHILSNEQ